MIVISVVKIFGKKNRNFGKGFYRLLHAREKGGIKLINGRELKKLKGNVNFALSNYIKLMLYGTLLLTISIKIN